MEKDRIKSLVDKLHQEPAPRVWSLLVAVFGELGQDGRKKISGTLLSVLTELMGIKPEATRVALHRLKKDGWLESEKVGRKSNYFLSARGLAKSVDATPLIYSQRPASNIAWIAHFDPQTPTLSVDIGDVWIAPFVLLTTQQIEHDAALVSVITDNHPVPDWVANKVCDPSLALHIKTLTENLRDFERQLPPDMELTPLEIAALRILVVHSWRRVILKTPNLTRRFFPEDWSGDLCRSIVFVLFDRLEHQNIDALEQAARGA